MSLSNRPRCIMFDAIIPFIFYLPYTVDCFHALFCSISLLSLLVFILILIFYIYILIFCALSNSICRPTSLYETFGDIATRPRSWNEGTFRDSPQSSQATSHTALRQGSTPPDTDFISLKGSEISPLTHLIISFNF